jgi:putative lipoic acid-binding regulatory protein
VSTNALLEFPCRIDVKVMGRADERFAELVLELVRRHVPDVTRDAVRSRLSQQGNYVALTVSVQAESREQMDALYRDLTAHEKIVIAL